MVVYRWTKDGTLWRIGEQAATIEALAGAESAIAGCDSCKSGKANLLCPICGGEGNVRIFGCPLGNLGLVVFPERRLYEDSEPQRESGSTRIGLYYG